MAVSVPPWLLVTLIASAFSLVGFVLAAWSEGFRSTPPKKRPPSPPAMSDFEIRFAKVEADQVELFSTLAKLTTSMQRLSSRAGMQALRERQSNDVPPVGTPKAELRKFYGVKGPHDA